MFEQEILYSHVKDLNQMDQIVQLQRNIWKDSATPLTQLVAAIHNGGVVITATRGQEIIGFCYGFPGYKDGQNYVVSHMLGIHPDYRDQGIGMKLKWKQRKWALEYGYKKIVWTFDPLESRNAFLNLCKLGGYVQTYIENYYGNLADGLNEGLPTDRFLLEWDLDSIKAVQAAEGFTYPINQETPILLDARLENSQLPIPIKNEIDEEAEAYFVAIPSAIHVIKQSAPLVASKWRFQVRETIQSLFTKGYVVQAVNKTQNQPYHYYVLEKRER
ncbi:MAG: GNAT family N-acetyltransferase [Bacilli bacterium]